ncbi:Colicin V secretion protein CvaA [compost metagenome]
MVDVVPEPRITNSSAKTIDPNLYRRQALDAATSRYGSPIRPTGLAGWALSMFMVTLFIGVVIFLVAGRYTRKESVPGVLQPAAGAARVIALRPGLITEVYVTDGQSVEVGDPILQLSSDLTVRSEGGAPTAVSELVEAGANRESQAITLQGRARIEAIEGSLEELLLRRRGLRKDLVHLAAATDLQQDRLRLAQETYEAGLSLHERQLFSTLQLRQREEAVLAARQGLSAIEREIQRNDEALGRLGAEEGRLKAQMAEASANLAVTRAQLDQRHADHLADHGTLLVAGKAGRIVALQARPGATIQPGRALAIILPPGATLQAELWVPSRAAGFLQAGDRVRLMYDAFPYQKFGVGRGAVASISEAPTDPADLTVPIETREALYRVLVNIDDASVGGYGRQWRLAPGMRLSADLVLDDRSLWEWLFDPIIAARRRAAA